MLYDFDTNPDTGTYYRTGRYNTMCNEFGGILYRTAAVAAPFEARVLA